MSVILHTAILPALERLGLHYLQDPGRPALVVPLPPPTAEHGMLLVSIEARDEEQIAMMRAQLCAVAPASRGRVALFLAELNTRFCFVTFSIIPEGFVMADVAVEFAGVSEDTRDEPVVRALMRLVHAIRESFAAIAAASRPRTSKRRPRIEKEIETLLEELGD